MADLKKKTKSRTIFSSLALYCRQFEADKFCMRYLMLLNHECNYIPSIREMPGNSIGIFLNLFMYEVDLVLMEVFG